MAGKEKPEQELSQSGCKQMIPEPVRPSLGGVGSTNSGVSEDVCLNPNSVIYKL